MTSKIITGIFGDVTKYFASENDSSGRQQHFRGHRQRVDPILDLVKRRAQNGPGRFAPSKEHKYIGTIPRTMLDDWLNEQGKTWHEYATDTDLRKAFLLFMTAERPRFFAKTWSV